MDVTDTNKVAGSKPWTEIMDDMENDMDRVTTNLGNDCKDEDIPKKEQCGRPQVSNRRQREEVNRLKGAPRPQKTTKEKVNQRPERDRDIEHLQSKITRLSNLLEMETRKKKSVLTDLCKERELNRKLGDDLQKYKENTKVSVRGNIQEENYSNPMQTSVNPEKGTNMNDCLSKEKESILMELQKERTMRWKLEEELQKCKDAILQTSEASQSKNPQNDKIETNNKLEQEMGEDLKAQIVKLLTRLETETKKSNSLVKEKETITTELQKCKNSLLQKSETLESSTMMENLCQKLKNLEKEKFEVNNKLKIEQEVNQSFQREAESLFARLQTEEKKNGDLERWMKSESTKLQKERRQRLELDVQLDKQAVAHKRELDALKESSAEIETIRQEVEGLKATILKLSTKLELEEELSESLRILNERLFSSLETETKKLEKEQGWRLKLNDNLQKEKDAHNQELEALGEELEKLKVDNTEILGLLQAEKEAGHKKSHHFFGRRKKNKETQVEESTTTSTSTSQRISNC